MLPEGDESEYQCRLGGRNPSYWYNDASNRGRLSFRGRQMLTRLKVTGFKNLVDVDIRFGPFTCIAGVNGVGKSNLFDAIRFLSALADRPFLEAAKCVRDEDGKTGDVRSLFHRVENIPDAEMAFEAEMIIPEKGYDDL